MLRLSHIRQALREAGDAAQCLVCADALLAAKPAIWPTPGPAPGWACICRCWSLLELARPAEALPILEQALSTEPKQPKLLAELQQLHTRCQQTIEDMVAAAAPKQPAVFTASVPDLQKLQHRPENVRNICMLAHVDHGKTSLTDALIASNRIISNKQVGQVSAYRCISSHRYSLALWW